MCSIDKKTDFISTARLCNAVCYNMHTVYVHTHTVQTVHNDTDVTSQYATFTSTVSYHTVCDSTYTIYTHTNKIYLFC